MPSSRLHPKSAQPKLDSFVKIFAYEAKLGATLSPERSKFSHKAAKKMTLTSAARSYDRQWIASHNRANIAIGYSAQYMRELVWRMACLLTIDLNVSRDRSLLYAV